MVYSSVFHSQIIQVMSVLEQFSVFSQNCFIKSHFHVEFASHISSPLSFSRWEWRCRSWVQGRAWCSWSWRCRSGLARGKLRRRFAVRKEMMRKVRMISHIYIVQLIQYNLFEFTTYFQYWSHYLYNIGFPWGGYKEILSHRLPIFPCILRKKEIQYYYHYLDNPCEIVNSLRQNGTNLC